MKKLIITIEEISEKPDSHTIIFDGDFDGSAKENVAGIESFVNSASEKTNLVFDFIKLHYMNSYGIGQLVNWHNVINQKGGKIAIVGANKDVEDIFAILGISGLFKTYPDMTSAIATL